MNSERFGGSAYAWNETATSGRSQPKLSVRFAIWEGGRLSFDSREHELAQDILPWLACHERAFGSHEAAEGESNGEPPRNRTENPQIKSLLLCQLS